MIKNRSAPPGPIVPVLTYDDVGKAIEWLCGAFGFTERFRTSPEPDRAIHHAQLAVGGGSVILTGTERNSAEFHSTTGLRSSCAAFVPVPDVRAHFERAREFGAVIDSLPTNCAFGEIQYTAVDLEGYRWTFSQSVADIAPSDWGASVAPMFDLKPQNALNPYPRVAPLLSVRHGSRAVEFYKVAFGASEIFCIQDDSGSIVARLSVGDSEFWVADESPEHSNFSPETLGGASVRMVMVFNDPDTAFQQAIAAGAVEVSPVCDQPYGWRVGRLVDPFGHHWEIGTPLDACSES